MNLVHTLTSIPGKNLVPDPLKSSCKALLRRVRLYDDRAARLRLKQISDEDTFIVSYPKSGNSWVRFILANMLSPSKEITLKNIEEYVPDIHKSRERINKMASPRFIKTHFPVYDCFPRFVYITRDVRDVMVSYYHYAEGRGLFSGSFSDFLKSSIPGSYGGWQKHVQNALSFAEKNGDRVLFLKYEDMLNTPDRAAWKIADFCRLDISPETVMNAVERTNFKNLQNVEKKYGAAFFNQPGSRFFRSGKRGEWASYFSPEDLSQIYSECGELLQSLGYDVSSIQAG